MKKVIIFTLFFCLILAQAVFAHPPSDIKIAFNPQSKAILAVIYHQVSNPRTHFIAKVDIGVNGKEIIEHKIARQDNNSTQTVSFLLPDIKSGDRISVEAYCSISGNLEKEITASGK